MEKGLHFKGMEKNMYGSLKANTALSLAVGVDWGEDL